MNVGELRALLRGLDAGLPIILQKDGEGNGYSPLADAELAVYVADSTYSGEVYGEDDPEKPEGEQALILSPVN